jgi:hypothetical protein
MPQMPVPPARAAAPVIVTRPVRTRSIGCGSCSRVVLRPKPCRSSPSPPRPTSALLQARQNLDRYAACMFVSGNAVEYFFKAPIGYQNNSKPQPAAVPAFHGARARHRGGTAGCGRARRAGRRAGRPMPDNLIPKPCGPWWASATGRAARAGGARRKPGCRGRRGFVRARLDCAPVGSRRRAGGFCRCVPAPRAGIQRRSLSARAPPARTARCGSSAARKRWPTWRACLRWPVSTGAAPARGDASAH